MYWDTGTAGQRDMHNIHFCILTSRRMFPSCPFLQSTMFLYRCLAIVPVFAFYTYVQPCNLLLWPFFFRCLAIVPVFAFYTYVQPCNLL